MSDRNLLGSIVAIIFIVPFSLVWVLACFVPVWAQGNYDPSQHISPTVVETPQEVMQASKDSDNNIFIGYNAGHSLTSGQYNVAIGYHTLNEDSTGTDPSWSH